MAFDRNKCAGCPLEACGRPSDLVGNPKAPYMVVTDVPTAFAAAKGRLMSERASGILSDELQAQGFRRDQFLFVPQVRCSYDDDSYTTKEKTLIRKTCRAHFLDAVAEFKPEVILPLGATPATQVAGRSVKITKVRGVPSYSEEHDCMIMALLHPGQVANYPQHHPVFAADVASFRRLVDSGYDVEASSNSMMGDYRIVDDLEFLIEQEPMLISLDTEDTSLEYFKTGTFDVRDYDPEVHAKQEPHAAILTIQLCIKPGESYMIVWDHPERPASPRKKKKLKEQLRRLLCRRGVRIIGQNIKFDVTYIAAHLDMLLRIGGDTLMLATLLDENMLQRNLDILTKHYVPEMAGYADAFNASVDKSRMWTVPLKQLLPYGCGDTDAALRLYHALWKLVSEDEKLVRHYQYVSLPGLNTLASMELRGLSVDDEALLAFEKLMAESVDRQYKELIAQVPRSIRKKHIDKGLSFSRGDFVRDILFDHKDGFRLKPKVFTKTTARLPAHLRVPSTSSKDHLPYFFDECPFTLALSQYVKDERLLSTSVRGFKNKYIHDGMVRPTYSLTTTVTGRTSSENPNGQNFPKRGNNATAYRRSYVAPPGYVVLEADLSQAELRISADMANDPVMLKVYNDGGDIHSTTAATTLNVPGEVFATWGHDTRKLIECANEIAGSGDYLRKLNPGKRKEVTVKDYYKAKRQEAKAINFGFIYGMGWRKFVGYAKTQYGVEFTDAEAEAIRNAYFRKYRALTPWHERTRAYAKKHKQVRSYSGRIRHLPMIDSDDDAIQSEASRQAINSPVQEFGSSLGVMAMGRLHERMDDRYIAPIAFVHDAIYVLVPIEYAIWGAQTLKWYMQTNPLEKWFGIRMKCPIVADVSIGYNLGDTYEMEGLTTDDEYDYEKLWDEKKQSGIKLPPQKIPPNNGKRTRPVYDFVD